MRRCLVVIATWLAVSGACATTPSSPPAPDGDDGGRVIPTRYDAGRFFASPVTAGGERLDLLLDTAGNNVLFTDVVARLGLAPVALGDPASPRREVALPPFRADAALPPPLAREGRVLVLDRWATMPEGDGVLGPEWFGWRVWLLDYPGRRLTLLPGPAAPPAAARPLELGVVDALQFPRVQVEIAGEAIDLLLDTGAHTRLVPAAVAALADGGPAVRATSYVVAGVFERWRAAHPEWRVVESAEERSAAPMIEVPRVLVAGLDVGPVWFTRRPDAAFHDFMSRWTDRRVDGALGGNALRDLQVWLDYPAGTAWVLRVRPE